MNSSKQKWLEILQKARLFAHLSIREIEVLAEAMFYSEFEAGQALVYEGESGNELFIIVEGTISVSVKSEGKEIELVRLGAGDFFGEMAMLEQEHRSATCKAVESTSCLVLKSQDFSSLIIDQPKIASTVLYNMLKITGGRLSKTDGLLSQIIRWGLDESFESLLKRCVRQHIGVSFAMVDIDHFGQLNRDYGAVFCDKVLLAIVDVFKSNFDTDDILIRYGGDEFSFIIRGMLERAEHQCKRVCTEVNALTFQEHPELRVSCSIGLAVYDEKMTTPELLKFSDTALYSAKEGGRNRVSIYKK